MQRIFGLFGDWKLYLFETFYKFVPLLYVQPLEHCMRCTRSRSRTKSEHSRSFIALPWPSLSYSKLKFSEKHLYIAMRKFTTRSRDCTIIENDYQYLLRILGKYYSISWSQGSHNQDAPIPKIWSKNKIYYCQLEVKVCETGRHCTHYKFVKLHVRRESMATCAQLILSHVVNELRQIKTNYIKLKVYFMAVL